MPPHPNQSWRFRSATSLFLLSGRSPSGPNLIRTRYSASCHSTPHTRQGKRLRFRRLRQHGWTDSLPRLNRTSISPALTNPSGPFCYSIPAVRLRSSWFRVGAAHVTNPSRIPYITAWSITMASYALNVPPSVPLKYTLLFGTGALIMRGAGCTINDLWDRNLDNAVGTSFQPVRSSRPSTRALFHSPALPLF